MDDNRNNNTKFWKAAEFKNLELIKAQYATHTFPKHMHETYVLGVILKGVEKFYCKGKMYEAPAGSIIIVNPEEIHTGYSAGDIPWTYRCLYPSIDLMQTIQDQLTGANKAIPYFPSKVIWDKKLHHKLKSFHIGVEKNIDSLILHDEFMESISRLIHHHAKGSFEFNEIGSEPDAVKIICEYLQENFDKSVSISQLSSVTGLSQFYLIRTFKKHKGITPHKYLVNIRIQKARTFLTNDQGIAEVAYKTGFSDQSHLTRTFKQIVGVTPGEYLS